MERQEMIRPAEQERVRLVHLDIMRAFAVFWVIFNHTGEDGFFLFAKQPVGSAAYCVDLFLSIFCKFAVPLFLAISGALTLNRPQEPLKKLWLGKVLKYALILIIWSAGYYVYFTILEKGRVEPLVFLKRLYAESLSGHLWYLYLYLAYLMVLPFLRSLVRGLEDRYFYYLFFLALFFGGVLQAAEFIASRGSVSLNAAAKVSWISNYAVLYPCLGYFMQHRLTKEQAKKLLPAAWILNVLTILLCCWLTTVKGMETGVLSETASQDFHDSFGMVNCVTMFLTFRCLFEGRKGKGALGKTLLSMGRCSFGIYLMHVAVLVLLLYQLQTRFSGIGVPRMIMCFAVCVAAMLISYLITLVMSKIPVVKKLVGF